MKHIVLVIGTRPEAIKLYPLALVLEKYQHVKTTLLFTGQHEQLVENFIHQDKFKQIIKCSVPLLGCSHAQRVSHLLSEISAQFETLQPDVVVVQGDTSSAFAAALAAQYHKTPIAHVEAGLRTYNTGSPWPEEAHRQMIDVMCDYYFAPTQRAQDNLIKEGIDPSKIWKVGNTSIDAVRLLKQSFSKKALLPNRSIVVTLHRHENRGTPLVSVCQALNAIAKSYKDINIQFCLHQNPQVADAVERELSSQPNIEVLPPCPHHEFVQLLDHSLFIITDSGGIQEEATYLGKPVLIIRDNTERQELLETGNGIIIGTNADDIVRHTKQLLDDTLTRDKMSKTQLPYGDGHAADQIANILTSVL